MPYVAAFNYYEELEVTQTATQQEINSSYRRLALAHHPDRNPGNAEAATAKFQRLGEAYETLSEPEKRARYNRTIATGYSHHASGTADGGSSRFPSGFAGSFWEAETRRRPSAYHQENDDEDGEGAFYYIRSGPNTFIKVTGFPTRGQYNPGWAAPWAASERVAAAQAAQAAHAQRTREAAEARGQAREERGRQRAEKEAREEAEAAAKNAAQKKEDEQRLEAGKKKQEERWEQAKVTSREQKQATCLHAFHWTKVKREQKLKCGSCHKKRGGFGFHCPYCEMLVCQLCQNQLSEKRRKLEKTQ